MGNLFLGAGDIPRAWPYFRAIGEPSPVAEAIERLDAEGEDLDRVIPALVEAQRVHAERVQKEGEPEPLGGSA